MGVPEALSFEEQLKLFKTRGMKVDDKDIHKVENIGYYRLKEFAQPLSTIQEVDGIKIPNYDGVSFSEVLTRYYQDKNLRLFFLHAIEKVEVSVKTKLSSLLGDQYGAFGYLDFSRWCDRNNNSKYKIETAQYFFKKNLKKSAQHSFSSDVRKKANQEKDGFPSVWLAIDVLTFGEMVRVIEVMSHRNQKKMANYYGCTAKEFVSWLKCLNFVRNLCAHNSPIIDLKLKTKPLYREEWKEILYTIDEGKDEERSSNRLAIVILIVFHFVNKINDRYGWKNISKSLNAICAGKEKNAQMLGFESLLAVKKVLKKTPTK